MGVVRLTLEGGDRRVTKKCYQPDFSIKIFIEKTLGLTLEGGSEKKTPPPPPKKKKFHRYLDNAG